MNGKKSRSRRAKAKKLGGYMRELYEIEVKEWQETEPLKILFISHYLWKKAKPMPPTDEEIQSYKKYFKK